MYNPVLNPEQIYFPTTLVISALFVNIGYRQTFLVPIFMPIFEYRHLETYEIIWYENIGNIGNHQDRCIGVSAKMSYQHALNHALYVRTTHFIQSSWSLKLLYRVSSSIIQAFHCDCFISTESIILSLEYVSQYFSLQKLLHHVDCEWVGKFV